MAPAVATHNRENAAERPYSKAIAGTTNAPAKGMMISEGRGIQADSIAISKTTPIYPDLEITAMMKPATGAMIFSSMSGLELELLGILRKGIAGNRHAIGGLSDFHPGGLCTWSGEVGRTEHGILGEQLGVDLGHQKIVSTCIIRPDLAQLDRLERHK